MYMKKRGEAGITLPPPYERIGPQLERYVSISTYGNIPTLDNYFKGFS